MFQWILSDATLITSEHLPDQQTALASLRLSGQHRLQDATEHEWRKAWPQLIRAAGDATLPPLHTHEEIRIVHLQSVRRLSQIRISAPDNSGEVINQI